MPVARDEDSGRMEGCAPVADRVVDDTLLPKKGPIRWGGIAWRPRLAGERGYDNPLAVALSPVHAAGGLPAADRHGPPESWASDSRPGPAAGFAKRIRFHGQGGKRSFRNRGGADSALFQDILDTQGITVRCMTVAPWVQAPVIPPRLRAQTFLPACEALGMTNRGCTRPATAGSRRGGDTRPPRVPPWAGHCPKAQGSPGRVRG